MESEDIVLKLLHTADWHLGRSFGTFGPEDGLTLGRARCEVLQRVLGEAERNQVDAVLCAGDLFDAPVPDQAFRDALLDVLRSRDWKGRPVFLLPGNHDPVINGSVWRDARFLAALPSFVRVVDQPLEVPLNDHAVLYAVPCQSSAGQADPTQLIPAREPGDGRIRVGLVHGSTWDVGGALTNFPIARDAAVERGLDYLAIGDTHGFRLVPPERLHPPTVYPGAPEQTAFDEQDAGHVALVFINRQRKARVDRSRVAQWTWEEVTVQSLAELQHLVARNDLGRLVLRLTVQLRAGALDYQEVERLLAVLAGSEAARGRVGILELDRSGLSLDATSVAEAVKDLPEVLKATAERLRQLTLDEATRRTAERALFHLLNLAREG